MILVFKGRPRKKGTNVLVFEEYGQEGQARVIGVHGIDFDVPRICQGWTRKTTKIFKISEQLFKMFEKCKPKCSSKVL